MDPCVQCFCSYGLAAGHIDAYRCSHIRLRVDPLCMLIALSEPILVWDLFYQW